MAWQSPSAMGAGNAGGSGGDGGNQVNQPQGTEYTLQGTEVNGIGMRGADMAGRGNALPSNRMAPARARPQCLGD